MQSGAAGCGASERPSGILSDNVHPQANPEALRLLSRPERCLFLMTRYE